MFASRLPPEHIGTLYVRLQVPPENIGTLYVRLQAPPRTYRNPICSLAGNPHGAGRAWVVRVQGLGFRIAMEL